MICASGKSASTAQGSARGAFVCRSCGAELARQVVDFGAMPVANALLRREDFSKGERYFPLHVMACEACSLVQLVDCPSAEVHFHEDYVYFSSYSKSWLEHCEVYAEDMAARFGLTPGDSVVEVASNDGYLLNIFKNKGFEVLGIEPSGSVAQRAVEKGIETEIEFFGEAVGKALAARGVKPRLVAANNVMAHVPDLNDFVRGFVHLLTGDAVLTVEVHYFRDLFEKTQFDALYHEHFSYFTIRAADRLFHRHGLRVFDVERLATHGGSLRLYICGADASHAASERLAQSLEEDDQFFADAIEQFDRFRARVHGICDDLRRFLSQASREGKTVAGFGAPAKATTLLALASITSDLLPFTVDSNPSKQGRYIPGVHIPILAPQALLESRPDYVVILPWNLKDEIIAQMDGVADWGGSFVSFVPRMEITAARS